MVRALEETDVRREANPAHSPQVLVVDPDANMRDLTKLHLANAGYSVVVAEDAVVAGRALLRCTPDVILLDAELPFLSGIELAATLVADATIPAVPLILISVHEHFAEKADSLGLNFLLKPFTNGELLEAIARITSRTAAPASVSHPSRFASAARTGRQPRATLVRS